MNPGAVAVSCHRTSCPPKTPSLRAAAPTTSWLSLVLFQEAHPQTATLLPLLTRSHADWSMSSSEPSAITQIIACASPAVLSTRGRLNQ